MINKNLLRIASVVLMLIFVLSTTSTVTATSGAVINSNVEMPNLICAACEYSGIDEAECSEQVIADYFASDMQQLSSIYSLAYPHSGEAFTASSIEYRIPVYIVTLDKIGIYLDFNDDNGYMIISEDCEVVSWQTSGDLQFLKSVESTYYSLWDGFGYYSEEQFVPYEVQFASSDELNNLVLEAKYDGQNSEGDGDIYDPVAYVNDKYGDGYTVNFGDIKYLTFTYFRQGEFSVYNELKNGGEYSEGNCSLAAIFALMNNLKTSGKYTSLPPASKKTNHYASTDPFYSKYNGKSNYVINSPILLPNLYLSVRDYAIDNYGYERSGTNPFNIATIIENVGSEYNADIDANHVVVWSYESQVIDEINAGYPVIINVANSATYGSHSMVVTGYVLFTKTTTILGINFYDYAKLARVNDNWTAAARYFDFTDYRAIGSFVTVR